MSDQFSICDVGRLSFGSIWAIRIRSWWSSKSSTCKKREAGASWPRRPTLERVQHRSARAPSDGEPQHIDQFLAKDKEPQPGSHVISPRCGYVHHGIYVGDGKVVHYGGLARGQFRGRIEEVSLAKFAYGRSVWTRSSNLPGFVPQEVLRRARSRVGENRYRVFRNNCEHFCEWCLRGESRSYQVERFLCCRSALVIRCWIGVAALSVLFGTTIWSFVSGPAAKSAYHQNRS
jgi:hypothetical protein